MTYTVRNSVKAFDEAIEAGFLSTDPNSPRYAGNYMYMESVGNADNFKHKVTRRTIWRGTGEPIAAQE